MAIASRRAQQQRRKQQAGVELENAPRLGEQQR
jgi:hypothetical protein